MMIILLSQYFLVICYDLDQLSTDKVWMGNRSLPPLPLAPPLPCHSLPFPSLLVISRAAVASCAFERGAGHNIVAVFVVRIVVHFLSHLLRWSSEC
jgi:hypothetical protein